MHGARPAPRRARVPAILASALIVPTLACASRTPAIEPASTPTIPEPPRPDRPVSIAVEVQDPVTRGELPWWHAVQDGVYRFDGALVVLAVGRSTSHHHVAEGFLASKVQARLAVRRAAERIRFAGPVPEPVLEDLFITRERTFLALYSLHVPKDAGVSSATITTLAPPDLLRMAGRRRVGRHVYERDRHLYLECDVEGPIANPDWGRTRASARG
ncbi:hypothetical protein L6R52_07310 [Myxococcota bacterium]|nr:hypothetical protein [Myxococcota bacterium]